MRINKIGGGITVVEKNQPIEELQLPIAGLMSELSLHEVARKVERINASIRKLGSKLEDPLMSLSFLTLPVVPELKCTDKGLVNVNTFDFVDLFMG